MLVPRALPQDSAATTPPQRDTVEDTNAVSIRRLPVNLFKDQVGIWTSPFRLQPDDANWLVPVGILTGSMIASDRWVQSTLDLSTSTKQRASTLSNAGLGGFVAAGGGLYLLGHMRHDDFQSRAGLLTGEAMVDALAVGEVLKVAFGRERPGAGSGRVKFFQGGNAFPSGHSILSWSAAAALTDAYPGWGSKMLFYGGATAVSMSRIFAAQHSPSDVVIGSTLGYLIGKKVYRSHTAELEINRQYGTFRRNPVGLNEPGTSNRDGAYVPIDSWVYPAFDRLIALGYINSGMLGLRPWTREECKRLLDEVPGDDDVEGTTGAPLISALRSEFSASEAQESGALGAGIDSLYFRGTGISGKPLTDDFNFGGTIVNDFGRPYQEGVNGIAGGSAHAEVGPLVFYVRGEYQHAPDAPPLPESARIALQEALQRGFDPTLPVPPAIGTPSIDRMRLLDAYVGWRFSHWQLSFGKQTLWWGPGAMGPMMISDNVEPITMARLNRVEPFTLPWIFRRLGPIRTEIFIGRLSGHQFVHVPPSTTAGSYTAALSDQPYITGQKITLKPTQNLEIGVSRTGLFGGPGFPVTPTRLKQVLFSTSTSNTLTNDPGDRRTSFDFNYRVPGLRKWLTLYADSMAEDEINPIAYPRRSAMNPGIFLPQLPKLNHMDLRAEAAYTDLPGLLLTDYFYWNLRYYNGYTNNGHIIGDWVGRQGKALQFSSNYWFTARNKVGVEYRKLAVNPDTGRRGTQNNLRASVDWTISPRIQASGWVQHERWNFPVLAPNPVSNTSVSLQLTFNPEWHVHR